MITRGGRCGSLNIRRRVVSAGRCLTGSREDSIKCLAED
jgi:hypothetical protein